ncbi:hypothetical protein BIY24_01765 [Halobacteriovorax marinus]|uniref:WbqC family protein n=1 Tax=Halobacteriovorax marinus TaxID=97084 RepID=UPI000BC304D6|nr:WbqC family protein [Halobacteriovorax marinus]ATH06708.1 hypothetical protein BIY24_01765 [Halobacteriovorax marinus]
MKKLACMQPYFFPYIGYFQLINYVDVFVSHDDGNYIKNHWINRNSIESSRGERVRFTVPVRKASHKLKIHEVLIDSDSFFFWKSKFLKTLEQNYGKQPNFNLVMDMVSSVLDSDLNSISELSLKSIREVSSLLEIKTEIIPSSRRYEYSGETVLNKIKIMCESEKSFCYVNPVGGKDFYSRSRFMEMSLNLEFMKSSSEFSFSIIDTLMRTSLEEVREKLMNYEIVL